MAPRYAGHQRVIVGKGMGVELREDAFAINVNIKYPAAARGQHGIDAELGLDQRSQTGRGRAVVSLAAVSDLDTHSAGFGEQVRYHARTLAAPRQNIAHG